MFESGRRFEDHEFPRSTWDVRRYFFAPRLGLRGIFRLSLFKDVTIISGAGVGGGSLGYANTLYRARPRFYDDPQWAGLEDDWEAELAPPTPAPLMIETSLNSESRKIPRRPRRGAKK